MSDHPVPAGSFVARQPIFDRNDAVMGYELLYRTGPQNVFPVGTDPDDASFALIDSCLHVHDLLGLVGDATPFINVTKNLLLGEALLILPKRTVIEVLEDVPATPEVLDACRRLSDAGYVMALDDFVGEPEREPLVDVVDILKIDFKLATDHTLRRELVERYACRGKQMLAEKVETREDEKHAKDVGYSLFQGFYYSKPRMQSRRDIPRIKQNYLLFLQQLRRPELDMTQIEALIHGEVSLSVRLLKYLNSCVFGLSRQITSIGQALVYLGEQPLRRWGSVVAIAGLGDDGPQELVATTLIRARFCELLAGRTGLDQGEAFLLGLVSSLDALLGKPREEVLAEIGVADEITCALDGDQSPLGRLFSGVSAYERGNWDEVSDSLESLMGDKNQVETITALYCEAVEWTRTLIEDPGESPAGVREVA